MLLKVCFLPEVVVLANSSLWDSQQGVQDMAEPGAARTELTQVVAPGVCQVASVWLQRPQALAVLLAS